MQSLTITSPLTEEGAPATMTPPAPPPPPLDSSPRSSQGDPEFEYTPALTPEQVRTLIGRYRRLYTEYQEAQTQYSQKPTFAHQAAKIESKTRLEYALGVELTLAELVRARTMGWLTEDVRLLRAAGGIKP